MNQLPALQYSVSHELANRFEVYPVLSREEEYELAVRLRDENDLEAAQTLITANLRHVVRIAMEYAGYGLPLEDIVQEGTIGLMVAVKKFDPSKGYRLMTYAMWWIKAMIHDYIMRFYSQVKLGTTKLQKKLFYSLNRLTQEAEAMDGSLEERAVAIGERLDADPRQVEEIITRLSYRDQSLDTPMGEDGDASFLDFLSDSHAGPEDRVIEQQRQGYVQTQIELALASLNERERDIARSRLMADEPSTLEELGLKYGISKERVRQIEVSVKLKLKKALAGQVEIFEG